LRQFYVQRTNEPPSQQACAATNPLEQRVRSSELADEAAPAPDPPEHASARPTPQRPIERKCILLLVDQCFKKAEPARRRQDPQAANCEVWVGLQISNLGPQAQIVAGECDHAERGLARGADVERRQVRPDDAEGPGLEHELLASKRILQLHGSAEIFH